MKRSLLRLFVFRMTLLALVAGCSPDNNASHPGKVLGTFSPPPAAPGAPVPGTGTGPAPTQPGTPPRNQMGTFDGGGGNGLQGRVVESYATKNIETLPEYKRFILPILRRMSAGKPDVMVAYLLWAARQKPWYFVPVDLPTLPKERIQLAFVSDQLALHSDQEIFIDGNAYAGKEAADRARLLLHEMVMAARLLMKKSPQKQCEALSRASELAECRNPETLKLAASVQGADSAEANTLNGLDHAAVRRMTVFLMDDRRDLNADNVYATRSQLGFLFPWDASVSRLTFADLRLAWQRSLYAEDRFEAAPNFAISDRRSTCQFSMSGNSKPGPWDYFNIALAYDAKSEQSLRSFSYGPTQARADVLDPKTGIYTKPIAVISTSQDRQTSDLRFEAEGVPSPNGDGSIVDRVRLSQPLGFIGPQNAYDSGIYEFYLTREANPRILEIDATAAQILDRSALSSSDAPPESLFNDREYVRISSLEPVRCRLVRAPAPADPAKPASPQ